MQHPVELGHQALILASAASPDSDSHSDSDSDTDSDFGSDCDSASLTKGGEPLVNHLSAGSGWENSEKLSEPGSVGQSLQTAQL